MVEALAIAVSAMGFGFVYGLSAREAGLSPLEAMAMSIPIIGTKTGANAELVRHGETGMITEVGDGEGLAAAIEAMLDDPAARQRMGERGRAIVETEYNAAVNVPRILATMKRGVERSRSVVRPQSSRA